MWKPNDRLLHRFNDELGPGRVVAVDGRTVVVEFPHSEQILRLASNSDALVPLELEVGMRVRPDDGDVATIEELLEDDRCRLSDGREVAAAELWPVAAEDGPFERLARGDVEPRRPSRSVSPPCAWPGCARPMASARSSAVACDCSPTSSTSPSARPVPTRFAGSSPTRSVSVRRSRRA